MYSQLVPRNGAPSRIALAGRSLLFMCALGGALAGYNLFTTRRELTIALGPHSYAQERLFVDDAEQPDIKIFYRKLTDAQKIRMAKNIGTYSDPELAKLCAILLGDFSPDARLALTDSLTEIGVIHPDAVAAQLVQTGSFERLGIAQAITRISDPAIPLVVKQLSVAASKDNAEAVLAQMGSKAIPVVEPLLNSSDPSARMNAAETLGRLRAYSAVNQLTSLYLRANKNERQTYLTALATIAAPSSASQLQTVLADFGENRSLRAQAALGLGRIALPDSVKALWQLAQSTDEDIRSACLGALLLCGDVALTKQNQPENMRLQVAAGMTSSGADEVIRLDLKDPALKLPALKAAVNRPSLIPDVAKLLEQKSNQEDGETADAAVAALISTPGGRTSLARFKSNPLLAGFIRRREELTGTSLASGV